MVGILRKLTDFLVGKGQNKIEIYGGNKGGFGILLAYDNTKNEVIGQYVSPPEKITKSVDVTGGVPIHGLPGTTTIGVKYESEIEFGKSFAIQNANKTSPVGLDEITPQVNEYNKKVGQPEIAITGPIKRLGADEAFVAGQYVVPVVPKDLEKPVFEAHFEELEKRVEESLNMFLEFTVASFWGRGNQEYRASIFLHDAITKELKMYVGYNMTGYDDYKLILNDSAGNVGKAFMERKNIIADFNVITHEARGVDAKAKKIWEDMKSILAVPITDSDEVPLGALSIDTSNDYITAKFNAPNINYSLRTMCRGIGRLLEGYIA
jgi:hypothetical protein